MGFEGLVEVVAERHRHLRGGRDHPGEPDNRNDAEQRVDDLGGCCPRADSGIGLGAVRGFSATDGDQRGQADQRQRLRIEFAGPGPASVVARWRGLEFGLPAPNR